MTMRRRKLFTALLFVLLLLVTFAFLRQPDTKPGTLPILVDRITREWQRWML
jgi:hypothetical protein